MLDEFFGAACGGVEWVRGVSDRAFAKARSHLHMPALQWLNDWLLGQAEQAHFVARWHGFRLVAADASVLMPAVRPCHQAASAAASDQRLFALYLPGAELTLYANVHSAAESERAMLMAALDRLGPRDVLLLDRGYPAAWVFQILIERGIRFVARCDGASWVAVRRFARSGLDEQDVVLSPVSKADAQDWGCQRVAPAVRLVRNVAPNGAVRVLATNLRPDEAPAAAFASLYHNRWRIEEAFKRLKLRLHLESVSGLSQQALIIDVAAKVLADNIAALMCATAAVDADCALRERRCNRSYAAKALRRLLTPVLLFIGDVIGLIDDALRLLAANTQRYRPERSRPRQPSRTKPHPSVAYKG